MFGGFSIAQMALVTPHPNETWIEKNLETNAYWDNLSLSVPITATSFAIDIYVFLLPMMGIGKLQLSARRKLGIILIFLTGLTSVRSRPIFV